MLSGTKGTVGQLINWIPLPLPPVLHDTTIHNYNHSTLVRLPSDALYYRFFSTLLLTTLTTKIFRMPYPKQMKRVIKLTREWGKRKTLTSLNGFKHMYSVMVCQRYCLKFRHFKLSYFLNFLGERSCNSLFTMHTLFLKTFGNESENCDVTLN